MRARLRAWVHWSKGGRCYGFSRGPRRITGSTLPTEGVTARGASAVVQDPVIDDTPEDGADLGAEGATAESAKNNANDGAEATADRSGSHADGEAGAGAAQCTSDATGCTGQTAERATGSLGHVTGFDAVGAAVGTLKVGQTEEAPLQVGEWKRRSTQTAKSPADREVVPGFLLVWSG